MLLSSLGLGWKHMESPQSSQQKDPLLLQKILGFSAKCTSCLVHLAYYLLLCCPLPEWVKGLLHGWWRHQNYCSL